MVMVRRGCGSGMELSWVGRGVREREMGDVNTCISAGRAVYVYYFKDIRQGSLQSDCVMLLGGAENARSRVLPVSVM